MKKKVFSERETIITDKSDIEHVYSGLGPKRCEASFRDPATGKELFRSMNSVIVPGALFTAQCHFPRITLPVNLPSYNSLLNLDNTVQTAKPDDQPREIWLFAVGTDGATSSSHINPIDRTKWIPESALVPFRYCEVGCDIQPSLRDMYYGRKTTEDKIAYYFKAFEADPICYARYKDGTIITPSMYTDNNKDAEIVVEIEFKINIDDCKDWFRYNSPNGLSDARINTISLLSAWYTIGDDGFKYFQDIQPVTKLNFKTEALDDVDKGLDIVYYLYY